MKQLQLKQPQLLFANILEQIKIYSIFKNNNRIINFLNKKLLKFINKFLFL